MLDFSILYDDGVVKKQAGSTRTAAAAPVTSGGHHKIETNMRLVHSTENRDATRPQSPGCSPAELLETKSIITKKALPP